MLKKIVLFLILSFCFVNIGFTDDTKTDECTGEENLCSPDFEIKVSDIVPGGENIEGVEEGNKADENGIAMLQVIITKLMIAFGVIVLGIMTIGSGFLIFYHGQDELLTKGKTIFTSGLIALVVALSAGIIIKIIAYLLY